MSIKETGDRAVNHAVRIIGSKWFFIAVLVLFVLQAAWLAASASYPMLYDEYYHPGLIDIYSKQWSPFITSQTAEQTAVYMDVTRTPSYLFHYLLSFPYRLITHFTNSFYIAIVSLRLINVALVAVGLVLFKKLLRSMEFGSATINSSLLIVTLLPIFPHLAAHVNYDNMLFMITPLFFIYVLKNLRDKSPRFSHLSILIAIGLLACLVKFTFLPILTVSVLYVCLSTLRKHRNKFVPKLTKDFRNQKVLYKIGLSLLLLVSVGLFAERYAVNMITQGNIQPGCVDVQPVKDCEKQPIVKRGIIARQKFKENPIPLDNIVEYSRNRWVPAMIEGVGATAAKIGSEEKMGDSVKRTEGGSQVRNLIAAFWIMLVLSTIFLAYSWRELRKLPNFNMFVAILVVYLLVVWIYINYLGYRRSGQANAMQPRYFISLMPILFTYILYATNRALRSKLIKVALFFIALLMFTQGGGIMTYIIRSNAGWYWQRESIINTNLRLKRLISPVIDEQ